MTVQNPVNLAVADRMPYCLLVGDGHLGDIYQIAVFCNLFVLFQERNFLFKAHIPPISPIVFLSHSGQSLFEVYLQQVVDVGHVKTANLYDFLKLFPVAPKFQYFQSSVYLLVFVCFACFFISAICSVLNLYFIFIT